MKNAQIQTGYLSTSSLFPTMLFRTIIISEHLLKAITVPTRHLFMMSELKLGSGD